MTFIPSKYQQAIFDWVEHDTGSAIIEAVAGSGKTTSIVEALKHLPGNEPAIFLAFNKAIAEELKNRMPVNATASTFHSAGFRAWGSVAPWAKVDDGKVRRITQSTLSSWERSTLFSMVVNLVGLGKQAGIGCLVEDVPDEWQRLIDHFGLEPDAYYPDAASRGITLAQKVLHESNTQGKSTVDYNDMLYLPILTNLPMRQYPYVFIDEAQDTNGVRRALAARMLSPGGRIVAVGDTHQAIYGFTGADSDAMKLIQDSFGAKVLPLSICYRSARSIVRKAKSYVPEIEPSDTAPEGIVDFTSLSPFGKTMTKAVPRDTDVILCRMNAPLVSLAYQFIGAGRGVRIAGREIGQGLVKLIHQMKAVDLNDLSSKLDEYSEREVSRLVSINKQGQAHALEDRVSCINVIILNLPNPRTVENLITTINSLFGDNQNGLLTLSTVHKAKGLEWDRVYIYRPELMPCPWARQDWEREQERNLQYVAVTRAKRELYYVVPDVVPDEGSKNGKEEGVNNVAN